MGAKQQANEVLDKVSEWTESVRAAVEAENWHHVNALAKLLRNFERMLRYHSKRQRTPTANTRTIAARLIEDGE